MKLSHILIIFFFVWLTIKQAVPTVAMSWLFVFSPLILLAGVGIAYVIIALIFSYSDKKKNKKK